MQTAGDRELLSVTDLEGFSGVSRYTWRMWLRQGRLPTVRLGGRVLVLRRDYDEFVEASRTESPAARARAK